VIPLTAHHLLIAEVTIWVAVVMTVYTGWRYYIDGREMFARAR